MSFPVPFYLSGGSDTPLGIVTCPNNSTTFAIGPDQERVLLSFCEPTGKKLLLQPIGTNTTTAGFCLQNGDTEWFWAVKHGPIVALGWQIRNDSGGPVDVTVMYVKKKGWKYQP